MQSSSRNRGQHVRQPFEHQPRTTTLGAAAEPERVYRTRQCGACQGACVFLDQCSKFKSLSMQQRKQLVADQNRCINCLKTGHNVDECLKYSFCRQDGCSVKHHYILHEQVETSVACAASSNSDSGFYLGIVPVQVECNDKMCYTYALLDDGSQKSLCTDRLLNVLGVEGSNVNFSVSSVTEENVPHTGKQIDLLVRPVTGGDAVKVERCWTIPKIPAGVECAPKQHDLSRWAHLNDVEIPELPVSATVTLLIGTDTPLAHISMQTRVGAYGEPWAVQSALGWAVRGPRDAPSTQVRNQSVSVSFARVHQDVSMQMQKTEATDVNEAAKGVTCISKEDQRANTANRDTITATKCGGYQIGCKNKSALQPDQFIEEERGTNVQDRLNNYEKMNHSDAGKKGKDLTQEPVKQAPDCLTQPDRYLAQQGEVSVLDPGKACVDYDYCVSKDKNLLQGSEFIKEFVGMPVRLCECSGLHIDTRICRMFVYLQAESRWK